MQKSATGSNWFYDLLLSPYKVTFDLPDLGRVVYPDQEERAQKWAKAETERAWSKMLKYYDEGKRTGWKSQFETEMARLHLDPLKRFEADWGGALDDAAFKNYFKHHFDDQDPNSRVGQGRTGCSAGAVYNREASLSYTPEPLTDAPTETFEAQLDADIAKPDAVMLRAVIANQATLANVLLNDKRGAVYDFMKGLLGEYVAAKTAGGKTMPPGVARTVSWLTDATLSFSAGLVSALGATAARSLDVALSARKAGTTAPPKLDPQVLNRLGKAQGMAYVHRVSEEALQAAMEGRAPKTPVLVIANFGHEEARQILKGRGELPNEKTMRRWAKKGQIQLAIFTDVDTIAGLKSERGIPLHDLAIKSPGTLVVEVTEQVLDLKSTGIAGVADGSMLMITPKQFLRIYEVQRTQVAMASEGLGAWLREVGKGACVQAGRQVVRSVDGRLAIGSMVVQGLSLLKAGADLEKAATSGDAEKLWDAWLGLIDGATGFLGGFFELAAAGWEARLAITAAAATAGKTASEVSATLSFLRGGAYGMGFAGNVVNAWVAFRAKDKLTKDGHTELARWMGYSGWLFTFGSVPLLLAVANQLAQFAIRRGLLAAGGAVTGHLARIVAVRVGTAAVGLTVPGIGWVLTIVAIGEMV